MKNYFRAAASGFLLPLVFSVFAVSVSVLLAALPIAVAPTPAAHAAALSGCLTPRMNAWSRYTFPAQAGAFTATVDATADAATTDALVGLSAAAPAAAPNDYTDLAVIVRFNSASHAIDARNGGAYSAAQTIPYVAGKSYHFRIVVNVASHTYSAYVIPAGGAEQVIGTNYAFRSEQAHVASLGYWTPFSDVSTFTVCNWTLAPVVTSVYDKAVLADHPVGFWDVHPMGYTEVDASGHGHNGTYKGVDLPVLATMPNGDKVARFNGTSQYLTVPSNSAFSIPTTGSLTWEAWIRPDVLQFPSAGSDGYIDFMGKCANYSPTCEWESRMYSTITAQGRASRISAYVFNPAAGLGSAADWQPASGVVAADQWLHVVAEYTTAAQPSGCLNTAAYPGSINIWVNGVKWNQPYHAPTGCMSQYSVVPRANNSPLTIGTMALDSWFKGAVGKVAIYNYPLTQAQINDHYQTMTGHAPTGSCETVCNFMLQ